MAAALLALGAVALQSCSTRTGGSPDSAAPSDKSCAWQSRPSCIEPPPEWDTFCHEGACLSTDPDNGPPSADCPLDSRLLTEVTGGCDDARAAVEAEAQAAVDAGTD